MHICHMGLFSFRLLIGLPVDTDNLERLNDDKNVGEAVTYLVMALKHWGITKTLNFQRGGMPLALLLAMGV